MSHKENIAIDTGYLHSSVVHVVKCRVCRVPRLGETR